MAYSMLVLSELNDLAATPTRVLAKITIGNFTCKRAFAWAWWIWAASSRA